MSNGIMNDWDTFDDGGMIDLNKTEAINRKVTPVFFIIDVSGSMSGKKIDIVNNTMESIMKDLSDMNDSPDFDIRFAVLSFGSSCTWETGSALQPCTGDWSPLTADGLTYFNTACRELKDKLSSKHGFFNFATGKTITPPVLILLTDGYANDGNQDGLDGVKELRENKYFKGSFKLAIAIESSGDDANKELCKNFTGDSELVFVAYNSKALKALLNAVIKGSVIVSSSGASNPNADGNKYPDPFEPNKENLIDILKGEMKGNPDLDESVNTVDNINWD